MLKLGGQSGDSLYAEPLEFTLPFMKNQLIIILFLLATPLGVMQGEDLLIQAELGEVHPLLQQFTPAFLIQEQQLPANRMGSLYAAKLQAEAGRLIPTKLTVNENVPALYAHIHHEPVFTRPMIHLRYWAYFASGDGIFIQLSLNEKNHDLELITTMTIDGHELMIHPTNQMKSQFIQAPLNSEQVSSPIDLRKVKGPLLFRIQGPVHQVTAIGPLELAGNTPNTTCPLARFPLESIPFLKEALVKQLLSSEDAFFMLAPPSSSQNQLQMTDVSPYLKANYIQKQWRYDTKNSPQFEKTLLELGFSNPTKSPTAVAAKPEPSAKITPPSPPAKPIKTEKPLPVKKLQAPPVTPASNSVQTVETKLTEKNDDKPEVKKTVKQDEKSASLPSPHEKQIWWLPKRFRQPLNENKRLMP